MKAVGIKLLKARLSEYVRLARTGETILVTERGEVVAELRPARRQPPGAVGELEEILEGLAAGGEVTRASASKRGWTWSATGLGLPAGAAAQILDVVRGERFGG